jgi:hypothetical protein
MYKEILKSNWQLAMSRIMLQDKKRNNQGVVVLAYIIYIAAFHRAEYVI